MDVKIQKFQDCAIEVICSRKLTDCQLNQLFQKYGRIKKICDTDVSQIIYLSPDKVIQACIDDSQNIILAIKKSSSNDNHQGDVQEREETNFKKIKKVFKRLTSKKLSSQNDIDLSSYVSQCSSPSFLNLSDPGIHLTYSFDEHATNLKGTISHFGTQELILMHLPSHFTREDVHKLFNDTEITHVELNTTYKNKILFATVKLEKTENFGKISEILSNSISNDSKIIVIPVTHSTNSSISNNPITN